MSHRMTVTIQAAILAALLGITSIAQASPVTLDGSFTMFTSSITPPNSVPEHAYVNGVEVFPLANGTPFSVAFGAGVNTIEFFSTSFGVPSTRNFVGFVPGPTVDVVVGQEFLLGRFTVENGAWFGDADMSFNLVTDSPDPALDGHVFNDTLHMHLNPFDTDIDVSADFFYFTGSPSLGSIRVHEIFQVGFNTLSVDFYGRISSLDPTRFANPQGAGFLSGSVGTDPNPITARPPTAASEPPPLALFVFVGGLGLLYRLYRRHGSPSTPF